DYYILVHGREGAGTGASFTVVATTAAFEITSFTPNKGSNGGDATVRLTGSRFTKNTTVTLTNVLGDVYAAADVSFVDPQHLNATFHLKRDSVPEGSFNIRATDNGTTVTAAALFGVNTGGGELSLSIIAPAYVRVGQSIPVTIKVINASGADAIAPIIEVKASNVADNQKL